jgi:hypothetical protein
LERAPPRLKIARQKAVHIGRKRKFNVPKLLNMRELRAMARNIKKKKCPSGYSKLKKKQLLSWIQKQG